jgi:hypothetical protein
MKVIQPEVVEIITKIAKKYDLPVYVVEDINRIQFSFLRKMMKNAKLNNEPKVLLLHKFGKFFPSLYKINRINEYNRKQRELLEAGIKTDSTINSGFSNKQSSSNNSD